MRFSTGAAHSPSRRIILLASISILFILGLLYEYQYSYAKEGTAQSYLRKPAPLWNFATGSKSTSKLWPAFAPILRAAAPRCSPPELTGKATAGNRPKNPPQYNDNLPNLIIMGDTDIDSLKRSHQWFISQIRANPPVLDYKPQTTGIVTSAGGQYFPPLLVSLRMLRRTGSTLPVEVFLANIDEYEPLMCDTIFPSLNAKCIVLSTILDDFLLPFTFDKYQLKAFAILFSSFEHVLFLDADNFPIHQPEPLFESEPYTSHGMVLWPDYWSSTTSPILSTITGLNESTFINRPTIEAGQILVSKQKHNMTLLLSAYYNAYGEYYYHLLSQGGPGEGDKETFASAALTLGTPFYTVSEPPRPLGQRGDGAAVIQANPIEDFAFVNEPEGTGKHKTAPAFFVHASWPPKLNALRNFRDRRQWGSKEDTIEMVGEDIEVVVWGEMVEMACDHYTAFRDWGDKWDVMEEDAGEKKIIEGGVCGRVKRSFRRMFGREYGEKEKESPG
ncbi:glycosyltransferase family 71 protein [Tricladium varicosporioides]|nr:glycosyltransferase family 71 protein [Hymenoscyphus varicosporioides]